MKICTSTATFITVTLAAVFVFSPAYANKTVFVATTPETAVSALVVLPNGNASPGMMHYVEHLTWMNAIGAMRAPDRHTNAETTSIDVMYWLSGAPEDLPDLLKTLSRVFAPIALPRDFAEQERNIIMREYEARMENNPDAQAAVAMNAFLYKGNAIAASAIGTPEQIMALDYDTARTLQTATHVPEDARLVVTGNVSEQQVRTAMREAGWPEPEGDPAQVVPPAFELAAPETTSLRYPDPDAAPRLIWRRVVSLPQPVQFDLLEARTALLRDILCTNLPGGLAGPLRYDNAIAISFDVSIKPVDKDNIEIFFVASPDAGIPLTELQTAFEAALSEIAASGIPESTYSRVLKRFERTWPDWEDEDETARWMANYVRDRVEGLREPLSQRELKRLPQGLSIETTNALVRGLAGKGRTAAAFIGPRDIFE